VEVPAAVSQPALTITSVVRGVSDTDLFRQAEADAEQARQRGYMPVSQVRGEADGVLTLTITYRYEHRWNTPVPSSAAQTWEEQQGGRSHLVGGLLAILLGSFGAHKFYNGKIAQGTIYILFIWTFIPTLLGFIEGLWYLSMSDADYNRRYPR
jgi:TM2 domain-containing membrane protein YozV